MKKMIILLAALLVPLTVVPSFAAQIRLFVAGISATGVQNRDEMQATLQTLLASRLNGDSIVAVGSASEADLVVTGTYVIFGKIFSLDAIAKTAAGKTVTRAFVQGESQDELIPAVGKLADKLSAELVKMSSNRQIPVPAPSMVVRPNVTISGTSAVLPAPGGDFIKPREQETNINTGWLSKRLIGAANLMAIGKTLPDGGREIFLAEAHRIAFYRQGSDMTLVSEAELGSEAKIISLDTIAGNDGGLDLYVTIIRGEEPSSQVWQVKSDKLVLVAEKLPFYFRSAGLTGGAKKLYAQAVGREDDFYGDVAEATRNGSVITLKNPIKMPRYGTIYNFNQFRDHDGNTFTLVIDPDGYLVVYGQDLKELWRSNDKFGGSELFFQKDDIINARSTGSMYRWVFMNQRIQVSSRGEILVGKNDGFWVLGNARSYKRGAVYCMLWNGSSLEEKWRTRETQNYMPDYFFDEARNELLILQTVQRPGITSRGASSLSIKKVE
jgi:hypothetical protein